jgi:hypothetical protein
MTDEYYDQIGQIADAAWKNADKSDCQRWGEIFDQSHRDSRNAWEIYGVDPDSPELKWRNDGASRTGPNGEVLGGGMPVAQWGTTAQAIAKGITAADLPAGYAAGSYERNGDLVLRSTHYAPATAQEANYAWVGYFLFAAIVAVVALIGMVAYGG